MMLVLNGKVQFLEEDMKIKKILISSLLAFLIVFPTFSTDIEADKNYTLVIKTEPAEAVAEISGPSLTQKVQTPTAIILPKAEYTITIIKEGYETITGKILLDQNKQMSVTLVKRQMEIRYNLSVKSKQADAIIEVSGDNIDLVKSKTPTVFKLPLGNYTVKVYKDGYTEFLTSLILDKDMQIDVALENVSSKLVIDIPKKLLNTMNENSAVLLEVYVNDEKIDGLETNLAEGKHKITIVFGAVKADYYIFTQENKKYTLRPNIDFLLMVE